MTGSITSLGSVGRIPTHFHRAPASFGQNATPLLHKKLGQQVSQKSVRNQSTPSSPVLCVPPASWTVHKRVKNIDNGSADIKQETPHKCKSHLLLIVQLATKSCHARTSEATVLLLKPLNFATESTDIAFTAKPTSKLCISYGFIHTVTPSVLTAKIPVNTGQINHVTRDSYLDRP